MIDSPSLQLCRCWLVSWDTCMCWRSPLIWLTAQQDSSQHYTFEDPCLHLDHNWGSSFLHLYITEDPPFCTRYIQNPEIWLVTINKSGTDQIMLVWELTLYKAVFQCVQRHSDHIPKTMAEGGLPTTAPPMGKRIPIEEDKPEVDPAGVINKREAMHHCQLISDAVQDFARWIKEGEIWDVLKQLVEEVQMVIKRVFPTIAKANVITILRAIPDCTCTALRDQSEEHERYLEEIMPEEDIPEGESSSRCVTN